MKAGISNIYTIDLTGSKMREKLHLLETFEGVRCVINRWTDTLMVSMVSINGITLEIKAPSKIL